MCFSQYGIYPFYPYLQKQVDDYWNVLCCTDDCFFHFCKRTHKSNIDKLADKIFPVYDLRCDIFPQWQEFITGYYRSLCMEYDIA